MRLQGRHCTALTRRSWRSNPSNSQKLIRFGLLYLRTVYFCICLMAGQIHKSRPQVSSVLLRAGKTIFQSDSSNFSVGLRKLCKMGLLSVSVSSSPSASWPLRMSHLSAVAMASRNSRLMVNLSLPEYLLSDCPRPAMARQFRAVRRLQSPAAGRPPWQSFHRASPRPPFASLAQRPRAGGR